MKGLKELGLDASKFTTASSGTSVVLLPNQGYSYETQTGIVVNVTVSNLDDVYTASAWIFNGDRYFQITISAGSPPQTLAIPSPNGFIEVYNYSPDNNGRPAIMVNFTPLT